MRDFHELQAQRGLRRFLASDAGALYLDPDATGDDRLLVRRFDGTIPPALTAAYADLVHAVEDWVMTRPAVARWVRVELPVEVGRDFITRPHVIYHVSTATYGELDAPPEPPELATMRAVVRGELEAAGADPRENVLARVITASLLEPSGRTTYDEFAEEFLVVEPKIDALDCREWHDLHA